MSRSLLLPIVLLAALTGNLPAQDPAPAPGGQVDLIAYWLDEAERRLANWDVRAAWSAALRAGYLVESTSPDHPMAYRAYVTLGRIAIRRGGYLRCRGFFSRAVTCTTGGLPDLSPIADGIAILAQRFTTSYAPRLQHVFEPELRERLSPDTARAIDALGPGRNPGHEDVVRYAGLARRTASRLRREWKVPCLSLAVLAEACRVLEQRAAGVGDERARAARARLLRLVNEEALERATHYFAVAERSGKGTDALGIPRNPGLAFQIGETFRVRSRWTPKDPTRSKSGKPLTGALSSGILHLLTATGPTWHSAVAKICYRRALRAEPDHTRAAVRLAALLIRDRRTAEAMEVMNALDRSLLAPTRAWSGEPVLPPAPRYMVATDVVDVLAAEVGGFDEVPEISAFELRSARAKIKPYLRIGPRFHPEDTVGSSQPFPDAIENNIGLNLLRDWDLTRAAQLFRRGIHFGESRGAGRGPMPILHQNLGLLYVLAGDLERGKRHYLASAELNAHDPLVWNNVAALMGIFASMTVDIDLLRQCADCYERSLAAAPNWSHARRSLTLTRNVVVNWDRFLNQGRRTPAVVLSFAGSFLNTARMVSGGEDPRFVQAMQILERGLHVLPSEEELARIFTKPLPRGAGRPAIERPPELRREMLAAFDRCRAGGVRKYEALLAEYGADNPHLNFLLAEILRLAWHVHAKDVDRDRAESLYAAVLRAAPDHVAAALGSAELLDSRGDGAAAVAVLDGVVEALLKPWRPWEGEPAPPTRVRVEDVRRLVRSTVRRLPDTASWRAFRRRVAARVGAAEAGSNER